MESGVAKEIHIAVVNYAPEGVAHLEDLPDSPIPSLGSLSRRYNRRAQLYCTELKCRRLVVTELNIIAYKTTWSKKSNHFLVNFILGISIHSPFSRKQRGTRKSLLLFEEN
jgi:hypothetical protein